ncbi:MAG: type II toxin-antitoxin system RelE/ParE family toxin [Deltaproteobacteria bacterium]
MTWKIEIVPNAIKELDKLDQQVAKRILKFLHKRVASLKDPRSIGDALKGPRFGEYWRYRVGDYRIITKIEDNIMLILVLRVGHRKQIYN